MASCICEGGAIGKDEKGGGEHLGNVVIDESITREEEQAEGGKGDEAGGNEPRPAVPRHLPEHVHRRDHACPEDGAEPHGGCDYPAPGDCTGEEAEGRRKGRIEGAPVDELPGGIRGHRVEPVVLREVVDHHLDLTEGVPGVGIVDGEKTPGRCEQGREASQCESEEEKGEKKDGNEDLAIFSEKCHTFHGEDYPDGLSFHPDIASESGVVKTGVPLVTGGPRFPGG